MSILLDAGSCLNFLAVGQQNVLVQFSSMSNLELKTSARVDREIYGKSRDIRFERTAAQSAWATLKSTERVRILDDDMTSQEFAGAIARISGKPAEERVRDKKSLGEILVLAHASVFAQQGKAVVVLIDDGDGRRRGRQELKWLAGRGVPNMPRLMKTQDLLVRAAAQQPSWIVNGLSWQQVYTRMRKFDDGLPPL